MARDMLRDFQAGDGEGGDADAENLLRFLDAVDGLPFIRDCKRAMLDLAPLGDGRAVLDVGCGAGHEVVRLAELVGSSGRVAGIDTSESMIAEARRRAEAAGVRVELDTASGRAIPYDDASFDVTRSERVLEYVSQPEQMIAEMARVTRPGGVVVNFDFDYDAALVDTADHAPWRRIREALIGVVPSGTVGRRMPGLHRDAGLTDVVVTPMVFLPPFVVVDRLLNGTVAATIAAGDLPAEVYQPWWNEVEQAERDGRYFAAFLGFVVAGQKP